MSCRCKSLPFSAVSSSQDVGLVNEGTTAEVQVINEESGHPGVLVGDSFPSTDDAFVDQSRVGLSANSCVKILAQL